MTRRRLLAVLATVLAAGTADGASFTLDARRAQEAVAAGEGSITRDDFGDEWRVRNAAGEEVLVMTPFYRVALAARHAAFRKSALRPRERDRIAREDGDRLVLRVDLKGPRPDFARFYLARLVAGERQVEAAFVQNERTPARGEDGRFVARCVYSFPRKALPPNGRVRLVIRDSDRREVNAFNLDLGAMR